MTPLEINIIEATKQTYNTILPCCFPKQDCNGTAINDMSDIIQSYIIQLAALGQITNAFMLEYHVQEANLLYLDKNCANLPPTTTQPPAVTTTEYVCCPTFAHLAVSMCKDLCEAFTGGLRLRKSLRHFLKTARARRNRRHQRSEDLSPLPVSLLNDTTKASNVIRNCVRNHDCNVTLGIELSDHIHNITSQIVTGGLEISNDILDQIGQNLRKISDDLEAAKEANGNS